MNEFMIFVLFNFVLLFAAEIRSFLNEKKLRSRIQELEINSKKMKNTIIRQSAVIDDLFKSTASLGDQLLKLTNEETQKEIAMTEADVVTEIKRRMSASDKKSRSPLTMARAFHEKLMLEKLETKEISEDDTTESEQK